MLLKAEVYFRLPPPTSTGTMGKRKAQEPATLETVGVYNKGRVKPDGSKEQRYYLRTKGTFGKKKKRHTSFDAEFTTKLFSGVFNTVAEATAHKPAFVVMVNGGQQPKNNRMPPAPTPTTMTSHWFKSWGTPCPCAASTRQGIYIPSS